MPIKVPSGLRRLNYDQFAHAAYEVMEVVPKVSALGEGRQRYESHLRRFLGHTALECIQWINVGRKVVTFKTIKR